MDDKALEERLTQITVEVAKLRAHGLATRDALMSLARTHPDKAALAANFASSAEAVIAHALSNPYPDYVVDALRTEYERLRELLDGNAKPPSSPLS